SRSSTTFRTCTPTLTFRTTSSRPSRRPEHRGEGAAPPQPRILGIDPGLVDTGYGVLTRGAQGIEVIGTGVISVATDLPLEARLGQVYDGMAEALDGFAPDVGVLEDLYTEYKFPRTAILMAHARGVICLAARQRKIAIVTLAPATVKRAIAASGAAS